MELLAIKMLMFLLGIIAGTALWHIVNGDKFSDLSKIEKIAIVASILLIIKFYRIVG